MLPLVTLQTKNWCKQTVFLLWTHKKRSGDNELYTTDSSTQLLSLIKHVHIYMYVYHHIFQISKTLFWLNQDYGYLQKQKLRKQAPRHIENILPVALCPSPPSFTFSTRLANMHFLSFCPKFNTPFTFSSVQQAATIHTNQEKFHEMAVRCTDGTLCHDGALVAAALCVCACSKQCKQMHSSCHQTSHKPYMLTRFGRIWKQRVPQRQHESKKT